MMQTNKNNKDNPAQRSDVVQWLDETTQRFLKIEKSTGAVISQKTTAGPYKNIQQVLARPPENIKTTASSSKQINNKVNKSNKIPKSTRKINYLNNKDILQQVIISKEQNRMTDRLAHMLQVLTARYGRKGNFANYTYNDDMQAYAMMMLVRTWDSFNPTKSQNPFSFFTQCIKNSFIQYLNQERKQRDIRDTILSDQGFDPSYAFQEACARRIDTMQQTSLDEEHIYIEQLPTEEDL